MDKEEAMKILKDFHDKSALFSVRTALETLHPELKESEDEKIRKDIIFYIKAIANNENISPDSKKECKTWIAWLEKQNSNVDNANKEYWRGYREGKQEILDKYAELEKQGELKPWSEEDEKKRKLLIDILNVNHPNGNFKVNPIGTTNMEAMSKDELVSWLKSLKQRIGGKLC
jgi:hypothetical protein